MTQKNKKKPNGYWFHNKQRCFEEGMKYTSKCEFKKGSPSAFRAAYLQGWLDEICKNLKHKTYWNKRKCKDIALTCKTKKEFREKCPAAYSYAAKRRFLNEICKHMELLGHYNKRKIYAFEFDDGFAYIGLSCNPNKRRLAHLRSSKSSVYKHIFTTQSSYNFKLLTDWMDKDLAARTEDEKIKEYARNGWYLLNKKAGGGLGTSRDYIYTEEEIKTEALKYKYRKEFANNSPHHYEFAIRHGIINKVCAHMPAHYMPPIIWNDEKLYEVVRECKTISNLIKTYPGAYEAILKRDLVFQMFGKHKKQFKNRTPECILNDISKYTSTKELRINDPSLYDYIVRRHLQNKYFTNLNKGKSLEEKCISLTIENFNKILDSCKH